MNDGVTVAFMALRSVVEHLDQGKVKLASQSVAEVVVLEAVRGVPRPVLRIHA